MGMFVFACVKCGHVCACVCVPLCVYMYVCVHVHTSNPYTVHGFDVCTNTRRSKEVMKTHQAKSCGCCSPCNTM